jgi:hypothetical protein
MCSSSASDDRQPGVELQVPTLPYRSRRGEAESLDRDRGIKDALGLEIQSEAADSAAP